jgi:FkbM family methyltransferase
VSTIRKIAKSCAVLVMGRKCRSRKILRGLASGYRISVSPAENLGYLLGIEERDLQRAIKRYVVAGDTAYDVGAHIGYVSLSLVKRVGQGGHVIAFEPFPRNVALLRANIANNSLSNVQVFDVAAWDRCGEAVIRISENFATASLVWHKNDRSAIEYKIKTVALDDLIEANGLPKPNFVKIDVEGAEGAVLSGMRRIIATAKPVLFVECSDAGRDTTWPMLRKLGYQCQSAITGKWIHVFEEYRHSDFLWLPPDLSTVVEDI